MKIYFCIIIFILFGNKLFAQITSTQFSSIDCDKTTTIITLVNGSPALYSFTMEALSCSVSYTGTISTSFTQFTVSCPAVYSFTFCDSGNFYSFLTHTVELSSLFTPSITSTKDTICKNENVTLSVSIMNSTYTISSFDWSNSATVTPITVTPITTTTYYFDGQFTTASSRTCNVIGTKTIVVNDCTGIEDIANMNHISIYPNPFTNSIFLTTGPMMFTQNYIFILRNIYGIEVAGHLINKNINSIDLHYLPKGIYYAEVLKNAQSVYKTKLIKQE